MTVAIQRIMDALSVGSTYALLALGLTLVFSVMNLINFAYGMMLVWTAFMAVVLIDAGVPVAVVVIACLGFATVLSIGIGRIAFRPFLTAPPVTLLITSFGVALVMQYVAVAVFGENPHVLRAPAYLTGIIHVGTVRVPVLQLTTIIVAALVMACFYMLLNRTSFGREIRAAAEKPDVARLMGISPNRTMLMVFAISGAIAGVAGLLWFAKVGVVTPRADLEPTFKAFVSIIIGGLGNTRGAIVGGLTLGTLEVVLSGLLPAGVIGYIDAIVFVGVIAILLLRPGGLLGSSQGL